MRDTRLYGQLPNPPKKAMSSFLLYRAQVFDIVKQQNPGLHITELTLIISQMWNNAPDQTKYRLQQEHQKNKIVTAMEKQEFQAKYGHVEKRRRRKRGKRGNPVINWPDMRQGRPLRGRGSRGPRGSRGSRGSRGGRVMINFDW